MPAEPTAAGPLSGGLAPSGQVQLVPDVRGAPCAPVAALAAATPAAAQYPVLAAAPGSSPPAPPAYPVYPLYGGGPPPSSGGVKVSDMAAIIALFITLMGIVFTAGTWVNKVNEELSTLQSDVNTMKVALNMPKSSVVPEKPPATAPAPPRN